jgi:hypothetical protein
LAHAAAVNGLPVRGVKGVFDHLNLSHP